MSDPPKQSTPVSNGSSSRKNGASSIQPAPSTPAGAPTSAPATPSAPGAAAAAPAAGAAAAQGGQAQRPTALTQVIYPVLSKLLKSNQEEGVIAALAQLKIAFDNAERAKPGITHSMIAQIIETLKR
jgi:hypothetical protein